MLSNNELRNNARETLGNGIFNSVWVSSAVACFLFSIILSVSSFFPLGAVIVSGPLFYGYARYFYNLTRRNHCEIGDLFSGFNECFLESFLLYLIQGIYTFLWTLLFIVPGIIKSYAYSMATFLQQRNGFSWKTCLDDSQKYMDGHKWQLFCLDLSFFGWYILGTLFFGVGIFFVYPYHTTARTQFFASILGEEVSFEDYEEVVVEEVYPLDPFEDIPSVEEIFGEEDTPSAKSVKGADSIGKDENNF